MMKVIEYKNNSELDEKIKKFVTSILITELNQKTYFPRPDLDDFDIYRRSGGKMWLIVSGAEILGSIAIIISDNHQAILKRFFVDKSLRSKGWGTKLFNNAINFCKSKKIKEVLLSNDSRNMAQAYKFYLNHGFKEISKRSDGYVTMKLCLS